MMTVTEVTIVHFNCQLNKIVMIYIIFSDTRTAFECFVIKTIQSHA